MYKSERIYTIFDILNGYRKFTTLAMSGKWLHDLGYIAGKRILVKVIKENNIFKFNISLFD